MNIEHPIYQIIINYAMDLQRNDSWLIFHTLARNMKDVLNSYNKSIRLTQEIKAKN